MFTGRLLPFLLLVGGCIACAASGIRIFDVAMQPVKTTEAGSPAISSPLAGHVELSEAFNSGDISQQSKPFLPVFGVVQTASTSVEASQVAELKPRFEYTLKGVIASGQMRWAILSGAQGDLLVREGDLIGTAARVEKIYAEGVVVSIAGEALEVTFSEAQPVERVAIDASDEGTVPPPPSQTRKDATLPRPKKQEIIYQNMTRDEVMAVLQEAENKRRARGWVRVTR